MEKPGKASLTLCLVIVTQLTAWVESELVGNLHGDLQVQQGQAIYTVPVELPRGPNHIQPDLSLVYNSAGGNGPIGQGWSLSLLSAISRCPHTYAQDDEIRGVQYDANDKFCLDGQRLVVVNGSSYGSDNSEYRTEIDSYSKIIAIGQSGVGPRSFRVWTKSGRILDYGSSRNGRKIGNQRTSVYQWNLEKIMDRFGNTVNLTYKSNGDILTGIFYGTTNVSFIYERRVDSKTAYFKRDMLSNLTERLIGIEIRNSDLIGQYKLEYTIYGSGGSNQSQLASVKLCDALENCMRPLQFDYGNSDKLTKSVPLPNHPTTDFTSGWSATENPRFIRDMNGDGLNDIVGFHSSCVKVALNDGNGSFSPAQCWVSAFGYSAGGWRGSSHPRYVEDVDGDGLPDIIGMHNDGVYVSFNTGNSFKSPVKLISDSFVYNAGWRTYRYPIHVMDVNGDGRADIVGFYYDGVYVALSKGQTFEPSGKWSDGFSYTRGWRIGKHMRFLKDVNGDHLLDIVGMSYGDVGVALNTGHSFLKSKRWLTDFHYNGGWQAEQPRFMEDMNGDGLSDIIGFKNDGVYISLSTGASFTPAVKRMNEFGYSTSPYYRVASHERLVADVTGDGLPDIIGFHSAGVYVSHNKGGGIFASPVMWVREFGYSKGWRIGTHPRHVLDMNGDGISDFIGFGSTRVHLSMNINSRPSISEITDSFNNTHSISYLSLPKALFSKHYIKVSGFAYPLVDPVAPMDIVIKIERYKGTIAANVTQYFYGGYKVDMSGYRALGFAWEKVVDDKSRSITTELEQKFPLTGRVKKIKQEISSAENTSVIISETLIMFEVHSEGAVHEILLSKEVMVTYDLTGDELYEVENMYRDSNGYGDPLQIVSRTSGGGQIFTKITINTYQSNVDEWYVGQLITSEVIHECPCLDPITRYIQYTYVTNSGQIDSETVEPNHELALTTNYKYDRFGNVFSRTQTPPNDIGQFRKTSTNYDNNGIYATSSKNGKGHLEQYTYDTATGNLLNLTGPNGLKTLWEYDSLGRKLKEYQADGTVITWSYNWDDSSPEAVYNIRMDSIGSPTKTRVYDSLDRIISEHSDGFDGSQVQEDITYNKVGLVEKHSHPHFGSEYPAWTIYKYDVLDRIISKISPASNGSTAEEHTLYNGMKYTKVDARGGTTHYENDALGRLKHVTDHLGGTITYEYNPVGNIIKLIDTDGHVSTTEYDLFGQKIKLNDPNMGQWEYKYNTFGELVWQKDAKQNILRQEYDVLGRLIKRNELEGETIWTYDSKPNGIGKLGSVQSFDGYSRSWQYDGYGREIQSITSYQGKSYQIDTKYDINGRICQQKYPNGQFVYRNYTTQGYLSEIGLGESSSNGVLVWQAEAYDALGRIKKEKYGNDLVTDYEYDSATHLIGITTHKDGFDMIRHVEYDYDLNANLVSRKDLVHQMTESFQYDPLDRLTQSTCFSTDSDAYQRRQNWDYFNNGNIRFNDMYGLGPFQYHSSKPHAVIKAGNHTYSYDANGNAIRKDENTIHWTSYNKPSQFEMNNGNMFFKYGPDRSRYLKTSSNGDKTFYLGKSYEEHDNNGTISTKVHIYGAMGQLIAIALKNETATSSKVSYIHSDNLGSVDTVTDENANIIERFNYDAFGMRRSGNWMVGGSGIRSSIRGYTGHEHLDEMGLIHMNGRVYDPEIGRFLSPDPHVQDLTNTQALNRYSYALNNPLKHNDPTGFFFKALKRFIKRFWKPIVAVAVSAITFGAAAPLAAGLVASAGLTGTAAAVATGALAGAVSGFAGGTVVTGNMKGGLQGAVGGAIFGGIGGYFGNSWNLPRVATQATAGGVVSELGGGKFKDGFVMAGLAAGARYLYNTFVKYDVDGGPGGPAMKKYEDTRPYEGRNNIGIQGDPPDPSWVDKDGFLGINWGEGGGVSRLLNRVPGVNAVSGMHDVFQVNLDRVFFPGARDWLNVPAMVPAAAISYLALSDGPGLPALLVDQTKKNK